LDRVPVAGEVADRDLGFEVATAVDLVGSFSPIRIWVRFYSYNLL